MSQRIQAEFTISSTSQEYASLVRRSFALLQQAREASVQRLNKERRNGHRGSSSNEVTATHDWIEPNEDNGHENFVFLAIARALGVIHLLEGLEFTRRTFYDITGSGGLAPLTAGMLFRWHHLKVIECLEQGVEAARNMVASCRLNGIHDLHKANVSYQLGDPLGADFVEADVVFVDATQLGFDEVALLHALVPKLEDLVAGSFIIILTHVQDPFPNGCPFLKLDCGASYSAPEPCERHVLLYKTVERSKDLRIEGGPAKDNNKKEHNHHHQQQQSPPSSAEGKAASPKHGGGK